MSVEEFRKKVTKLSTPNLIKKYENDVYQTTEEIKIVEDILVRRGYEIQKTEVSNEEIPESIAAAEANVGKIAKFIPHRKTEEVEIEIRAVRVDPRVNRYYYSAYGVADKVRYAPSINNKTIKILD